MIKTKKLSNGIEMPMVGLGVWRADEEMTAKSVHWAIDAGYRLIDTAAFYKNESGVRKGMSLANIDRKDLFITTKLWNDEHGYELAHQAFNNSLERLGLDYIDLYLIHWPVKGKFCETWRALEEIYNSGRAKAIGVSNFHKHHIEDLMQKAKIKPMVNQIELHPTLTQRSLRKFLIQENIAIEAWSPLGQGKILSNYTLESIGNKYGKSPAQIIIRWHLQNGVIVIPKSVHRDRIQQNFMVFDFELTENEMDIINALNTDEHLGGDPDNFDF